MFRSYDHPSSPFEGSYSAKAWQATRACTTVPFYFPLFTTEIDGQTMQFLDGVVFGATDPAQVALLEAMSYNRSIDHGDVVPHVVSIGTPVEKDTSPTTETRIWKRCINYLLGLRYIDSFLAWVLPRPRIVPLLRRAVLTCCSTGQAEITAK